MSPTTIYIIAGLGIFVVLIAAALALYFYTKSSDVKSPGPLPEPIPPPAPACATYEKLVSNRDLPGYEVWSKTIANADDCLKECDKDSNCNWVSYSQPETKCIGKSWSVAPVPDHVAYVKLPDDCDYFQTNVTSSSTRVGSTINNIASKEDCAAKCKESDECDTAVYHIPYQNCQLYKGATNDFHTYVNTTRAT